MWGMDSRITSKVSTIASKISWLWSNGCGYFANYDAEDEDAADEEDDDDDDDAADDDDDGNDDNDRNDEDEE